MIDELELKVEVIRGKSEAIKGRYDFVTARAVAPLPRLMEISWHLIRPGGSLLAIKGESASAELAETKLTGVAKHQLHEIKLEDLPVSRVVELVKAG